MAAETTTTNPTDPAVLDTDIEQFPGVGERRAEPLRKAGVKTYGDLLRYYPRRYLDRSTVTPIREIREAGPYTVVGTVTSKGMIPGRGGRSRFELRVTDDSGGTLKCVWFRGANWIQRLYNRGDLYAFHGKAEQYGSQFSMAHPESDKLDDASAALTTGRIVPLYPGGAALEKVGLNSRTLRKLIYRMFKEHGLAIPEVLPASVRERYGLMEGNVALRAVHFPKDVAERGRAVRRLKFEEFFFLQLLLALTKGKQERQPGITLDGLGAYGRQFLDDVLPFELTGAQQRVLDTIAADTASGRQMNRLVQGDVGSGKTVVGVAAMLMAVDAGYQAAFMAPTEILTEQHYANIRRFLEPLGLKAHLLIGGQRKTLRDEILAEIADGTAHVVVGTHAVIEDKVAFQNLGLAVVDEQHRFGVVQRAKMFKKGQRPHVLMMTATPIPRSLAMTVYGDLDVSAIDELPAGRKPIDTRVYSEKRRDEMLDFVKRQLREGRQAYVVYPLVEESESETLADVKDAENGAAELMEALRPYRVDLVHGRMFSYEKDEAMDRFKSGETDVLVATTVIEVGVDVPNATVMVIEHAERFGLSQLHQLRGRVGRGADQSYCFLMAAYKRTADAEERLQAMADTTDGFEISEIDLNLRGAGDFFGTRQSGLPDLKIGDLVKDAEILSEAREAAFALADEDPGLADAAHAGTRAHFAKTAPRSLGFARVG
ncbi:ATP-dependent DNA helicase RecG [Rubrivirga marina]|uniref:ATP-dependent DNA helicase RecG n=1 Tax=Rubrivirga marina TaxID=1196024 RepID=A0A271IXN1_9BACT|nr:ATP-dependent DNA helicase RecG [Rubrivirga marina]PAP75698.1 ATP-dependent DNA helicase RecG [Rubrivirga marina]